MKARTIKFSAVTGWGKTIGWSKRNHYFFEGQSFCSGSISDGKVSPVKPRTNVCPDCAKKLEAHAGRVNGTSTRPTRIGARLAHAGAK